MNYGGDLKSLVIRDTSRPKHGKFHMSRSFVLRLGRMTDVTTWF